MKESKITSKKINKNHFVFSSKKGKSLKHYKTKILSLYNSEEEAAENIKKTNEFLSEAQEKLFANRKQAVLIILQGMDTSGKDGIIKHVMSVFNPQGVVVKSFKSPNAEELSHDFLWRTNVVLPKRGEIAIFNRSYYEEVIVTKIHKEFLKYQNIPDKLLQDKNFWKNRMLDICEVEKYLTRQGFKILKFFLHISKEEQCKRLLKRLKNPNKHWKFEMGDIRERSYWDDYQKAYYECLKGTHQKKSPWYIIPADEKINTRVIISDILKDTFTEMSLKYPKTDSELKKNLDKIKNQLKLEATS